MHRQDNSIEPKLKPATDFCAVGATAHPAGGLECRSNWRFSNHRARFLALASAEAGKINSMPRRNRDLHGNVPDESTTALLLLDVINDFEFAGSDKLLKHAVAVVSKLTALKVRAREAGIPAVYVNDNFGRGLRTSATYRNIASATA